MQVMFHVKIKQNIRKLGNICSEKQVIVMCNAKTGDVKAQTLLSVTIKIHFVNCQSTLTII